MNASAVQLRLPKPLKRRLLSRSKPKRLWSPPWPCSTARWRRGSGARHGPQVAAAAVAFARRPHDLERGLPDRQRLETKIEELRGRAAAKRSAADAIKARRLRGVERPAMLPSCTRSTKMPWGSMASLPTRSRSWRR